MHIEKLFEDSISSSGDKYRLLIESVNDIIYTGDCDGLMLYMNRQGAEFSGCSIEELRGVALATFIDPGHKRRVLEFYQKQLEEQVETSYLEFPIVSKRGTRMWVGQRLRLLFDSKESWKLIGVLGVLRDITEKRIMEQQLLLTNKVLEKRVSWRTNELEKANRKLREEIALRTKTETALKQSESEYIELFQNAHDAIMVIDHSSLKVLRVNEHACALYNYNSRQFSELHLKDISAEAELASFVNALKFDTNVKMEATHFTNSGKKIVVDIHATRIRYRGGDAIMSINRDITQKREVENELALERARRLTALIDGQEMERRRLSSELHDGLGQLLTASLIYIKKLDNVVADAKSKELVAKTREILESTVDEVRAISHNLMPAILSDFGLETALRNMVNTINNDHKLNVRFVQRGVFNRLTADVEIGLYRIAQEALNNSLKYSKANNITVSLVVSKNGELRMTIEDDGVGLGSYAKNHKEYGNGIYNMVQRASVINCQISIESEGRAGTLIGVIHNLVLNE